MARANAKVILLGEHAVVYGISAIAAGIDRGATATAREAEVASVQVGSLAANSGDDSDLGRALAALRVELDAPPLAVRVSLEIPPGCGLGASAAIGVAVARATLEALSPGAAEAQAAGREVMAAAKAWEQVFHGNPSGIDTAAAMLGGCISFTRGQGPRRLVVACPLRLAIAIAGPPASTRAMVEGVARLREQRPRAIADTLSGIASVVGRAELALAEGDAPRLGRLMDENHRLLQGLGVSTEGLDRAIELARDAGALGAKLTGAGGGGAVVALLPADPHTVLDAWRQHGLECFYTTVEAAREPAPAESGAI